MAKKVLVTGGSSGIGECIVRSLAALGYDVKFTYFKGKDRAEKIARETGAKPFYLDLADVGSIDECAKAVGKIDILINNAGVAEIKLFTDVTLSELDNMLGVDLRGTYILTQKIVPNMISNKWGRIVNISSMWGVSGASCEVSYSSAKAGLIGFTKALAKELGLSGITCNCVAPGLIDTPMSDILSEEDKQGFVSMIPIPRVGTTDDVANAVEFFISERSSYVTGQVLCVDGGCVV
ncbi:MAG: SDR family oxidoreductase [Clostridia bacterium]|nr:SDR family oxidoreductase [Clostridia bacterium]